MESSYQNVTFLGDENWLSDLACLTYITQHLSELCLKPQRKSQLENKLLEHICVFEKNIELFQVKLGKATLTHVMCLAANKMEYPYLDSTNYTVSVQKLHNEFTSRLPESK